MPVYIAAEGASHATAKKSFTLVQDVCKTEAPLTKRKREDTPSSDQDSQEEEDNESNDDEEYEEDIDIAAQNGPAWLVEAVEIIKRARAEGNDDQ